MAIQPSLTAWSARACTGGSGIFTERDPRKDCPEYRDCDLCLFTLADAEKDGRLNFLMPSAYMIKRDFSKVLYDMSID